MGRGTLQKESGRGKHRFKMRGLRADGRCSQAVLDFLSTAGVGRLAPAGEGVGSEVSKCEPRERGQRMGNPDKKCAAII